MTEQQKERLDKEEIRKALDEATPGDWSLEEDDDGELVVMAASLDVPGRYESVFGFDPEINYTKEDAHLIAIAPAWLHALLEENKQLEERTAEKTLLWGECEDQNRQLQEELERKIDALSVSRGVMNRLAEELAAKDKVLEFARAVLRVAFDGGSLDGGDIQDLGDKYGLLNEESYDPEKHGESLEWEFEPGDTIYTFSDILKAASHET